MQKNSYNNRYMKEVVYVTMKRQHRTGQGSTREREGRKRREGREKRERGREEKEGGQKKEGGQREDGGKR